MRLPATVRAYFSIDPRSLAAFRIGLGLLLLAEFGGRAFAIEAHYTDSGILPRAALTGLAAHPVYSLHMLSGELAFQVALFFVSGVSAALLALGLYSRAATVVAYVMLFSVQNRNPLLNHADDDLKLVLLLWAMFLPLGAMWSLDARRRGATHATPMVFSPGSIALTLQPLMVYLTVSVSKFQYASWTEGRAVHAFLNKSAYLRPLGEWAVTVPGFTTFATYAALVVEAALVLLFASPWRRPVARTVGVALGAMFHATLFSMLDVWLFQPLMVLATVPLLPSEAWDRFPKFRIAAPGGASPAGNGRGRAPLRRFAALVCGGFLCCALISVPGSLARMPTAYPEPLASVYRVLKLQQRYRMFANMDATPQGWWVVAGKLADGRLVNAREPAEPLRMERPTRAAAHPARYWASISRPELASFRPFIAEYFCRRWNRDTRVPERMSAIEFIYVKERATHPDRPAVTTPITLLRGPCPAE